MGGSNLPGVGIRRWNGSRLAFGAAMRSGIFKEDLDREEEVDGLVNQKDDQGSLRDQPRQRRRWQEVFYDVIHNLHMFRQGGTDRKCAVCFSAMASRLLFFGPILSGVSHAKGCYLVHSCAYISFTVT